MHFVKLGEYFVGSHITGPTHNLLQIRLSSSVNTPPICECLPSKTECRHNPINQEKLIKYVLQGAAEANAELGTNFSVSHIRYIENDTPPEVVYGYITMRIIKHLHTGGEFVSGISVEP